jgi:hypothetical protein
VSEESKGFARLLHLCVTPPIANTATIGTSSQFDLVDNLDGGVSPRAHVNGRIVTADNARRHY